MTLRERIADWLTGGASRQEWATRELKWREVAHGYRAELNKQAARAANIAAQRDAAEKRAEVAEERLRAVEADLERAKRTAKVTDANWRQLAAELARIRAADRTSITVRTTEAAKMRKGQAI